MKRLRSVALAVLGVLAGAATGAPSNALWSAAEQGNLEQVELLIARGAVLTGQRQFRRVARKQQRAYFLFELFDSQTDGRLDPAHPFERAREAPSFNNGQRGPLLPPYGQSA